MQRALIRFGLCILGCVPLLAGGCVVGCADRSTGPPMKAAPATASAPAAEQEDRASLAGTRTIVVLGDSNSASEFEGLGQGPPWPALMATALETRYPLVRVRMINTAAFGRTSAQVLAGLQKDCLSRSPDIVMLMIGTNDPANGISLEGTVSNVRSTIRRVRAIQAGDGRSPRVILMQPPVAQSKHVAESAHLFPLWCPYDESENPANSLRPMKQRYTQLANELDVVLVETWDHFAALGYDGSQPIKSAFLLDGLHLSAEGQRLVSGWAAEQAATVW
jgi:lysophospholipase L1-like esterase